MPRGRARGGRVRGLPPRVSPLEPDPVPQLWVLLPRAHTASISSRRLSRRGRTSRRRCTSRARASCVSTRPCGSSFDGELFRPAAAAHALRPQGPCTACASRRSRRPRTRSLPPGEPIGFSPPTGWPADRIVNFIAPEHPPEARRRSGGPAIALEGADSPRAPEGADQLVARCGPYVLVRTR